MRHSVAVNRVSYTAGSQAAISAQATQKFVEKEKEHDAVSADNNLFFESSEAVSVVSTFDDLGLKEDLIRGIYAYNFEKPSAIQQRAILPITQGRDVIAQAQSRTGKTATASISILQSIDGTMQSVVLALGDYMNVQCHACVGGMSIGEDIRKLEHGQHVVSGTPASILEALRSGHLHTRNIKTLVLDEADELLNKGFGDQIYNIYQYLPPMTQVVLLSATLPADALEMTKKIMTNPVRVLVKDDEVSSAGTVTRWARPTAEGFDEESDLTDLSGDEEGDGPAFVSRTEIEHHLGVVPIVSSADLDHLLETYLEENHAGGPLPRDAASAERARRFRRASKPCVPTHTEREYEESQERGERGPERASLKRTKAPAAETMPPLKRVHLLVPPVPTRSTREDGWMHGKNLLAPNLEYKRVKLDLGRKQPTATPSNDAPRNAKNRDRRSQGSKAVRKHRRGGTSEEAKARWREKQMGRADAYQSMDFDLVQDASFASTNLQGTPLPALPRSQIIELFFKKPGGAALSPYIEKFLLVPYKREHDIAKEVPTCLMDVKARIWCWRTARIHWAMDRRDEFQELHDLFVKQDLLNHRIQAVYADRERGPHMAIIAGWYRQSAKRPTLAAWHRDNEDLMENILKLKVMKDLIGQITAVVEHVFPGIAKRFRKESKWHKKNYGIEPHFGLFWNFCLNAWFPGQKFISCGPHADSKNTATICALFVYVLKGFEFNDDEYIWLVIWEAGVAIQLPAWTLLLYPSALFFHFNIDMADMKLVVVKGKDRPTPENSRPLASGGKEGRGSIVLFNQSTMRAGPLTKRDTFAEAREKDNWPGISRDEAVEDAFKRLCIFEKLTAEFP
ncbi:DEAD-domain-containing protein [Mycena kentingensis (nom. inval.)]|nr:DEAD-domain-containing protein [Mycena kentingensis (nom. inval.)]